MTIQYLIHTYLVPAAHLLNFLDRIEYFSLALFGLHSLAKGQIRIEKRAENQA